MAWELELQPQAREWRESLRGRERDHLEAALSLLRQQGPGLGRPFVDSIKASRHHNMKELRVGTSRALFAFDPRRCAVVLLAGDKQNDWRGWYQRNIPRADRLYDQHLRGLGVGDRQWETRMRLSRVATRGR